MHSGVVQLSRLQSKTIKAQNKLNVENDLACYNKILLKELSYLKITQPR
jgi:hypothetical protein